MSVREIEDARRIDANSGNFLRRSTDSVCQTCPYVRSKITCVAYSDALRSVT